MKKSELIKKIKETRSAVDMLHMRDDIIKALEGKEERK